MKPTREDVIAGLRQFADLMEKHPDLPMPCLDGDINHSLLIPHVLALESLTAALGRPVRAEVKGSGDDCYLLFWQLAGVEVTAYLSAERVAEHIEIHRYIHHGVEKVVREWTLRPEFQPTNTAVEA